MDTVIFLPISKKQQQQKDKYVLTLHYSKLLRINNKPVRLKDRLKKTTQIIHSLSTLSSCKEKHIINLPHQKKIIDNIRFVE